jgi:hypothetical protein
MRWLLAWEREEMNHAAERIQLEKGSAAIG